MYEKVYELIDKNDVISFDLFDTLIVRNVLKPTDIFDIVEMRYNISRPNVKLVEFKKKRIEAELNARKKEKREITLNDIYINMQLDKDVSARLQCLEKAVELDYIKRDEDVFLLYEYAIKKNKIVIITTDMYLPRDFIITILEKCHISGYSHLYLSGEIGIRKKEGDLYKYICNELNCKCNKILHIGDNPVSDYKMAKKNKVNAYLLDKKNDNLYYYKRKKDYIENNISNNVAMSLIKNYSISQKNCKRLGYKILGLPLVGFCQWIHDNNFRKKKFFLARDGYLIMEAYKLLYPEEVNECYYLYLSRKSLRKPNIFSGISYENLVEQLPSLSEYNVKIFCDLLGIKNERTELYCEKYKNIETVHSRLQLMNNSQFKELYYKIKEEDRDEFEKQFYLLKNYLLKEKFYGDVTVIDVGWRGTAQINLSKICGNNVSITGYYFGVEESNSNIDVERERYNGYFWGWNDSNKIKGCFLNGRKGIFEQMFLSNQGSVINYQDKNGEITPIKEKDYNNQEVTSLLQMGALEFVHDYSKYNEELPNFESEDTYVGLLEFMKYPKSKDMKIGDAVCENYRISYLAKPNNLSYYMHNLSELKKDFMNSEWKIGFITRLFKVNKFIQVPLNIIYEKKRHK